MKNCLVSLLVFAMTCGCFASCNILNKEQENCCRCCCQNNAADGCCNESNLQNDDNSNNKTENNDMQNNTLSGDYYEAEVVFFVNPYKNEETEDAINPDSSTTSNIGSQYGVYGAYGRHVMDNMIKLLSSESFSEFLIDGVESVGGQMKGTPIKYDEEENLTEEYKTFLKRVDEAVTFSYSDNEDIENLARSLIYVNISVKDDETFANSILENIITIVPWYIVRNMPVPADFDGTKCEKVSTQEKVELVRK